MEQNKQVQDAQVVEENPKIKVELDEKSWGVVLSVIDNSTSSYIQVKSVIYALTNQLKPEQVKED